MRPTFQKGSTQSDFTKKEIRNNCEPPIQIKTKINTLFSPLRRALFDLCQLKRNEKHFFIKKSGLVS